MPRWLALGVVAVLMGLVLRAAWVTEDAYITLRTVDNWVNGAGLRWNVGERVQGYTHPLWMFLLSVPYYFTRESYLTTLLLGIGTTLGAALLTLRNARSTGHAVTAIGLLLLSRSFVEFSTSGLENPLTHVLVAQFVWVYAVRHDGLRRVALCAALIALNRSDALIVALPALVHTLWLSFSEHGLKRTLKDLTIGVSPYLAWLAFSLFYYGFLVPNTAFAKLNTGLPFREVARQGLTYVLNAMAWDPPLLVIIGLGVAVALAYKAPRHRLLAVGVVLYVAYVVEIGGDFMLGRFLTLPFFLAVSLVAISELPLEEPSRLALVVLPLLALFFHPTALEKYPVGDFHHSGVADERFYYREGAGLMFFTRTHGLPTHHWANAGREASTKAEKVVVHENIGFFGFFAGPRIHIIDLNALTEPLLARLPSRYSPDWRVGHYLRKLPEGYLETVKSGTCQMDDKSLCEYQAKLKLIVTDDLFSFDRLKAIVGMNLGSYDYLVDRDRYRYPDLVRSDAVALSAVVPENAFWDSPGTRTISVDGISIDLGATSHASRLAVSLDGNDQYDLELYAGDELRGTVTAYSLNIGAMHSRTFDLPRDATEKGFDRVWIRPIVGDTKYAVGFLRLLR